MNKRIDYSNTTNNSIKNAVLLILDLCPVVTSGIRIPVIIGNTFPSFVDTSMSQENYQTISKTELC